MAVCLALIGLILIQQGKGGGLVAFGGSGVEQAFGTRAATLAQKATAFLGVLFIVLVIVLGKMYHSYRRPLVVGADAPVSEPAAPLSSEMPASAPPPAPAPAEGQ